MKTEMLLLNAVTNVYKKPCISVYRLLQRETIRSVKSLATNSNYNLSSEVLRTVDFEKGFHFFTEERAYTGITARSLFEFLQKLETIDAQSVKYHFRRGDFQNWITNTLKDPKLSDRINRIDAGSPAEFLRKNLLEVVQLRIDEFQQPSR